MKLALLSPHAPQVGFYYNLTKTESHLVFKIDRAIEEKVDYLFFPKEEQISRRALISDKITFLGKQAWITFLNNEMYPSKFSIKGASSLEIEGNHFCHVSNDANISVYFYEASVLIMLEVKEDTTVSLKIPRAIQILINGKETIKGQGICGFQNGMLKLNLEKGQYSVAVTL